MCSVSSQIVPEVLLCTSPSLSTRKPECELDTEAAGCRVDGLLVGTGIVYGEPGVFKVLVKGRRNQYE